MEWITDPATWASLATLVTLEIVLGIDNLVFIAILSDKLPKHLRDKARIVGLSLALITRLVLLASIAWLLTLTEPFLTLFNHVFSVKDLILLFGGLFLLFKATMELNERLEGKDLEGGDQRLTARFWPVVTQIVVLDAVFSLDSVITAIHVADHLPIMMLAVCIAIAVMLFASKGLTTFINAHPTIVILCLSFLLMIGFSLVAEGCGYHIPKGYLYAAIAFSVVIEFFNQLAQFNRRKFLSSSRSLRQRTAEAVLRLLSGKSETAELDNHSAGLVADADTRQQEIFNPQELQMIERVLGLAQRSVGSIMTSRYEINYLDISSSEEVIREALNNNQHTRLVITEDSMTNAPLGVIHVNDLLKQQLHQRQLDLHALIKQPLTFPEKLSLLMAVEQFRQACTHFAFVVDEFGSVEGIVTLTDVMETIAGNLPVEDEGIDVRHDIQKQDDESWIVNGFMPLEDLASYLPIPVEEKRDYNTIAGLLMEHTQHIPTIGEKIHIGNWLFEPLEVKGHRILKVHIIPAVSIADEHND